MGDEPSCFQSVVNGFNRLRKGVVGLFRRIIHFGRQPEHPNGIAADSVNPDPVQLQLIRPLENSQEDVRDRDPLQIYVPRLQIFVPVPPDFPVPPPPPPPPFEPPRRRRHSRPAPTYDLATLIEIKDALETLEMSEQLAAVNSTQIHENSTRIHENIVISDHTDQSTTSTTSTKGTRMSETSILRRLP